MNLEVPKCNSQTLSEKEKQLRRIRLGLPILLCLVAMLALTFLIMAAIGSNTKFKSNGLASFLSLLVWLEVGAYITHLVRWGFSECPRCGNLFFIRNLRGNPFANACRHCALSISAGINVICEEEFKEESGDK